MNHVDSYIQQKVRSFRTFTCILLLIPTLASCASATKQQGMMRPPNYDETLQQSHPQKSSPDIRSAQLWYHIQINETDLQIAARVIDPQYDSTRFYLPRNHSDLYSPPGSPRLTSFHAEDPTHHSQLSVTLHEDDDQYVSVERGDADQFDFTYTVQLSKRRVIGKPKEQLLLGPTFLAVPAREVLATTTNIPIEIVAPESYVIATTWKPIEIQRSSHPGYLVYGFVASEPRELRDSFLFFGPNITLVNAGPNAMLAFGPSFSDNERKEIVNDYNNLIRNYATSLGELTSYTGVLRRRSTSNSDHLEPDGMGRLNGFVIQIPKSQSTHTPDFKILLAHEALHMWNGHQLVAATSAAADTGWMTEGVTQYLALKTSLQLGWISYNRFKQEMTRAADQFNSNPSRLNKNANLIDKIRLPYDHGTLLGYYIDCSLNPKHRSETLSNRQLEGWLRLFIKKMGEQTYTSDNIFYTLSQYSESLDLDPRYFRSRLVELEDIAKHPAGLKPGRIFANCPL